MHPWPCTWMGGVVGVRSEPQRLFYGRKKPTLSPKVWLREKSPKRWAARTLSAPALSAAQERGPRRGPRGSHAWKGSCASASAASPGYRPSGGARVPCSLVRSLDPSSCASLSHHRIGRGACAGQSKPHQVQWVARRTVAISASPPAPSLRVAPPARCSRASRRRRRTARSLCRSPS